MSDEQHYQPQYGRWAGRPEGVAPDFKRCCASLHDKWHPGGYQCSRKRGFGPDLAYCRQHDPETVKKRRDEVRTAGEKRYRKQRLEWAGPRFYEVLKQIADGHNDPRTIAALAIKTYHPPKGEQP